MDSGKEKVSRISVSLPENLLHQFDSLVVERDYENRSQAIADVLQHRLNQYHEDVGKEVMAGTINLVFDNSIPNLQKSLTDIQLANIDEVISSLNVNLTGSQTMSVILVQGPGDTLKAIANEMISRRGVVTGKLLLATAIIPQVHPFPK